MRGAGRRICSSGRRAAKPPAALRSAWVLQTAASPLPLAVLRRRTRQTAALTRQQERCSSRRRHPCRRRRRRRRVVAAAVAGDEGVLRVLVGPAHRRTDGAGTLRPPVHVRGVLAHAAAAARAHGAAVPHLRRASGVGGANCRRVRRVPGQTKPCACRGVAAARNSTTHRTPAHSAARQQQRRPAAAGDASWSERCGLARALACPRSRARSVSSLRQLRSLRCRSMSACV